MYLSIIITIILFISLFSTSFSSLLLNSSPIWNQYNTTSLFSYFRSPIFKVSSIPSSSSLSSEISYLLFITARQSPQVGIGNYGSKLPSSFKLYVNGILITVGPGHNVAYQNYNTNQTQIVMKINVSKLINKYNIISIASYFNQSNLEYEIPRVQAELCTTIDGDTCNDVIIGTDSKWYSWNADIYHNPEGDENLTPWYSQPNEFLNTNYYPLNWNQIDFNFDNTWNPSIIQPSFNAAFICLNDPPFALLTRSACNVDRVNENDYLIDFGQEFSGGLNLTFNKIPTANWIISIRVGEALDIYGNLIAPSKAGQNPVSNWTLSTNSDLNIGIYQHEMLQFRYALILNSPIELTVENVKAWVLQHAVGATGINPFEFSCSTSTPIINNIPTGSLISWSSSSINLDRVFNFTSYTAIATSFDVNVDSRTRQRDLCHADALITIELQNSVFSSDDKYVQRKTTLYSFANGTSCTTKSGDQTVAAFIEFRLSGVMMVYLDVLETSSLELANMMWSSDDFSITSDIGTLNSLQFFAGIRYFNLSGLGLMSYPVHDDTGFGGSTVLCDWPVGTRDGYPVINNTDDSIRNSFSIIALNALSMIAKWRGEIAKVDEYEKMSNSIFTGLTKYLLRYNITSDYQEAYFVDGAIGDATEHAAIHSTIYAAAAGVSDNNPKLATLLSNYLIRRDLGPSSCMTAKWVMIACYRLSQYDPSGSAADYVLSLLERTTYPSWGYMIERGATITMESWRPEDKPNMDWGHPWCAYPASGIPRLLLGVQPIAPGWSEILIRPQPSTLGFINASIPTPLGSLVVNYNYDPGVSVTLLVNFLSQMNVRVCLVYPVQGTQTNFLINDMKIEFYEDGRMICMLQNSYLQNGLNNIQLIL